MNKTRNNILLFTEYIKQSEIVYNKSIDEFEEKLKAAIDPKKKPPPAPKKEKVVIGELDLGDIAVIQNLKQINLTI